MPRQPLPLERRTELRDLIDDDLLATLTRTSNSLAARFTREWFGLVSLLGDAGYVMVFDTFVVGPPEPVLHEAVHHLRKLSAEPGDSGERWLTEVECLAAGDLELPLTIPERVCEAVGESLRLVSRPDLEYLLGWRLGVGQNDVFDVMRVARGVECYAAGLADFARVSGSVVIAIDDWADLDQPSVVEDAA